MNDQGEVSLDAALFQEKERLDHHDAIELLQQGVMEVAPDRAVLDRMLAEYWNPPNTKQLNIRIQPSAKRMIEKLAKGKTLDVSPLVRMWVIDSMRREASQG